MWAERGSNGGKKNALKKSEQWRISVQQFVLNGAGINCVDFKLVDCCNLKKHKRGGHHVFLFVLFKVQPPLI